MDRPDLELVTAVRQHGSLVMAARALRVAPSAVTKRLAALEADLGLRLFQRTTRSVTLTSEGALFLERCRKILAEVEAAEFELCDAAAKPHGKLRISLPQVHGLVMPVMTEFMALYPQIELDLDLTDRMVDVVEEGFDAVIRTGKPRDSRLMARPLGEFHMVLVASPSAGMPNIAGFIERVKQNPGKFSYGSAGVGTALNLAGEMVKQAAGLFIVHIPYRGVGPLTTDLIGGQVELGVYVLSSGLPQIKAGKVVPLGVTERERSPVAPDIPALAETPSLRHVDIGTWFGLWGPAGLPAPVAQRLRGALAESLKVPSLVEKLTASGATIAPASAVLADFQAAEIAKYRRIVDPAGIRV